MPPNLHFVNGLYPQSQASDLSLFISPQIKLMSEKGSLIEWLEGLGLARHLNNSDIMSGITVSAVLSKTVEGYQSRVGEANTAAMRIQNWNNLVRQLEKVGVGVGQQEKAKILNGDDKVVYNILYELKAIHSKHKKEVGVDLQQIDIRTDPKNATSLLQLLILLLVKHFGLSVKESVALLSNDSKYLAHVLAKGFKDSPSPVQGLLLQLSKLLPQVSVFCKNRQNLTFFVKSFKPGLISKYLSVSEITLQLLTQFIKTVEPKYELIKQELISTYLLCIRRHTCLISLIAQSIITILGFNKNILDLVLANASLKEAAELFIELINLAEMYKQDKELVTMFNFEDFVKKVVDNIRSSQTFISSCHLLLKLLEINYSELVENRQLLNKMLDNLSLLNLFKRSDIIIQTDIIFAMLAVLGKRKNGLAPQYYKLAVEKYRNSLDSQESENYLQNFYSIIQIFPSIPKNSLVQAILFRYQTGSCNMAELQLQILQNSITQIDQQTVLRVYNTVTKVFMEQAGKEKYLSNIIESIIRTFDSKIIMDLSIKFTKVCLAVFYANLRKLNYSKSLVEGTIKLNHSNAFYKVKNTEIVSLVGSIVGIEDERLNKAIQPLVCYSFFQSQIKNKEEAEQLKRIMIIFGTEEQLRNLYEQDARHLLEEVRKEENKNGDRYNEQNKRIDAKTRVNSDILLLSKKKDYALYNLQPISSDAKEGLERYSKAFKSRLAKLELQEEQKRLQEHKMDQLRKKATLKILEKGLKITKEIEVNNLYQFDSKQRQLQKEEFNHLQSLPFYDASKEEDRDVKGMQILLKKYAPIFKVYYHHYGGKLRPNTILLFQDISQTAHLMQSANAWKLLRDHNLDNFITIKEVHYTIQKINALLKKEYKDSSLLDYEVFQNFIIQVALIMFSRPPKDMRSYPLPGMVIEIVKTLKQRASQNKIDQKLFEEEKQDFKVSNQQTMQQMKDLNEKLAQNSDYILPEGYKKIIKKNIVYDYLIKIQSNQAIQNRFQDVVEVIDEILFQALGLHIIEPYSSLTVEATARPLLYQQNYQKANKERSLSSILPKASKNTQRAEADEENLQQTKEQGAEDQQQRVRLENRIIKERKQKELEMKKRKEQQDRKREQRDKELKQLMEKHKQKQVELQKEKEKQEQQKKRQQEQLKNNKKKYEQQLKKKVQEYSKIKEAQKAKQEHANRQKRDQEFRKMAKMKEDIEKKKKMVEQSKQKKREEQREKEEQEKSAKSLKQQQEKKRLQFEKQVKKKLILQFKQRKKRQDEQKSKEIAQESSPEPKHTDKVTSKKDKPVKDKQPTQEKQVLPEKPTQERQKASGKKQITIQTYQQP